MIERQADHPFHFTSCMELREALGKRALDEQRLLEIIEEAPADCIYYHTHSYFLRHPYAQRLFPNDFATWVALHTQDRMLGEKLGSLDPFAFEDIEQLRNEIVTIITDHLRHTGTVPRCLTGEPFEFVRSHVIDVPLELTAATLREFRDALTDIEVGAVYNHLCEARLRKGRLKGDFARWLSAEDGLRMPDLAEQVERVGHRGLSLEAMRQRIVALCDHALAGAGSGER